MKKRGRPPKKKYLVIQELLMNGISTVHAAPSDYADDPDHQILNQFDDYVTAEKWRIAIMLEKYFDDEISRTVKAVKRLRSNHNREQPVVRSERVNSAISNMLLALLDFGTIVQQEYGYAWDAPELNDPDIHFLECQGGQS